METKDLILTSALDLFAKKGYTAASVRDIAKLVGIKDSSLYFHFKNKRAIFDALTERFVEKSTVMTEMLNSGLEQLPIMTDEIFLGVTNGFAADYFGDEFIRKFIGIMAHEQSSDCEIRRLYQTWCCEKPVELQSGFFRRLQEMKFLKNADAEAQATMYYSPIFMYFSIYLLHGSSPESMEFYLNAVRSQTQYFLKENRYE